MAYKLPPLRFTYDALEPSIDAETMELHHDRHHQAYVDNLNKALFTEEAAKRFGAGWAFLVGNPSTGRLEIMSLPNQDSVLLHGEAGLLCPDYPRAWWNVVAWDVVDERLRNFMRGTSQLQ